MTDILKYCVITVYKKSYNKQFITGKNKYWYIDLAEKENKKFKVEAIMIDNKVLRYEDVPIDDHAHLGKYIIRIVNGSIVVYIVGMLSST